MTADFDNETYDARVAERFAELDRLEAPELFAQAAVSPRVTGTVPSRRRPVDTWVLAAAAATIALLGVFAVFVGVWDGDGNGAESVAADRELDEAPLDLDEEATGEASTEGEGGADGVEATPSVTADSGASDTTVPTTATTEAPTTTTNTTTTEPTTTAKDVITVPYSPPTASDGTVLTVVSGTVTEVFTDCYQHLILTEDGGVDDSGPVTCDGGSWVVINGIRIGTASGFVRSDDDVYDKHLRDLQPGDLASAIAIPTANGALNLNCEGCDLHRGLAVHGG